MITLPEALQKFMQQQDLTGLKPYALLYRNKWVEEESGSGDTGHYELETTPIDITDMIVKPNTLSMTLDVNEVAQYNCNNVTLTLADTKNRFIEGTQNSLFPDGYQIYGSKVVLYYGLNNPINPYRTQVGYTVVGSPTIVKGIASNFSLTDYCKLNEVFAPSTNVWQEQIKFKLNYPGSNIVQALQNETKGDFRGVKLEIETASSSTINIKTNLSSNGSSWDIVSGRIYGVSFDYSKWAYILIKFTGTQYIYQFKQEGGEYTTIRTVNNSSVIYQSNTNTGMSIGCDMSSGPSWVSYFRGEIDLKETYIKVNGEYWFNGAAFFYEPQNTPLFTGMIKELPTYKPEKYQLDLKLVSPLEMLKDIEAKDFSNKVTGETLTYKNTDSDGHKIYWTSGTGVGGFSAVYANGTKLFEGVDYEVTQTSVLNFPAIVTIINSSHYNKTITADYYCWKTDLTVEQVVKGLADLGGYDSTTEDIRDVSWVNEVRNPPQHSGIFAAIGYYQNSTYEYKYNWKPTRDNSWQKTNEGSRRHVYPSNFDFSFQLTQSVSEISINQAFRATTTLSMGDTSNSNTIEDNSFDTYLGTTVNLGITGVKNGLSVRIMTARIRLKDDQHQVLPQYANGCYIYVHKISNGSATQLYKGTFTQASTFNSGTIKVSKRGNTVTVYRNNTQIATTTISTSMNYEWQGRYKTSSFTMKNDYALNQNWNIYDNNLVLIGSNLTNPCVVSDVNDKTVLGQTWYAVLATLTGSSSNYFLKLYFSNDASSWSAAMNYILNTAIGRTERYLYFILGINNKPGSSFDIADCMTQFLASTLQLNLVNLAGLTVLEALQDFALISGYEFGVDRNGVFFFRPRVESTTPIYTLDHNELVKVDTVKKNFSDFFTKLTLTFAQVPLEFYANEGTRPTAVDKYGVINKEIDKPEIVNYDNPELAQAIGPQLLAAYASFPDVIQCVGKMNLALELADIVLLERNYNLITPADASEYDKYSKQQTYYRACKITGLNYNFSKNQITYTLRDVSNADNSPQYGDDMYEFVYDLPIQLGAK